MHAKYLITFVIESVWWEPTVTEPQINATMGIRAIRYYCLLDHCANQMAVVFRKNSEKFKTIKTQSIYAN